MVGVSNMVLKINKKGTMDIIIFSSFILLIILLISIGIYIYQNSQLGINNKCSKNQSECVCEYCIDSDSNQLYTYEDITISYCKKNKLENDKCGKYRYKTEEERYNITSFKTNLPQSIITKTDLSSWSKEDIAKGVRCNLPDGTDLNCTITSQVQCEGKRYEFGAVPKEDDA